MSAQVTITQLPQAGTITGTEAVPIVQNGQTVQTTTGAISASPSQTQTFITVNQEPTLANSRYLSTNTGVTLVDGGAQSSLQVNLTGAVSQLNPLGGGIVVKNGAGTLINRSIAYTGAGLDVLNADGTGGNPTIQLTGVAAAVANLTGTGMLAMVKVPSSILQQRPEDLISHPHSHLSSCQVDWFLPFSKFLIGALLVTHHAQ